MAPIRPAWTFSRAARPPGSSAGANFVVTVNNGGSTQLFNGSFTASQADGGLAGAGRFITTFVHSGSSLTTQDAPVAPQPLTPDVLRKMAISHATIH
jgi:hypothetical protein